MFSNEKPSGSDEFALTLTVAATDGATVSGLLSANITPTFKQLWPDVEGTEQIQSQRSQNRI